MTFSETNAQPVARNQVHLQAAITGWEDELLVAATLFDGLASDSTGGIGITRDTYGIGEQSAHDRVRRFGNQLNLEIQTDDALNLYLTFPGQDRSLAAAFTGSHLDSVPCGGNFDGAAGVVAGLTIFARWRRLGYTPPHDCTVMAIRAEESAWFPVSYIGSKAAFGLLTGEALSVVREDTGLTLAHHIETLGGAPTRLMEGKAFLNPQAICRFVEVHIEQGPLLVDQGISVGIVNGIRGAFRFRHAEANGQYAHSGAETRATRKDAVLATAKLITALDKDWDDMEAEGRDVVVTCGKFFTDAVRADFSKVAGHVQFTLDVRSFETETLTKMEARVRGRALEISAESGVDLSLGEVTRSVPAEMNRTLREALKSTAQMLNIQVLEMPSGAGHDASTFAGQDIPTAMIFVRNENGSHNPDEAMTLGDLKDAMQLLEVLMQQPVV